MRTFKFICPNDTGQFILTYQIFQLCVSVNTFVRTGLVHPTPRFKQNRSLIQQSVRKRRDKKTTFEATLVST